jgi:cytochrome c-type biogenesis protein CcmF
MFFAFIGLTFVASLSILISRWPDLKGESQLDSMFSREALFTLNNLLFMGILIVCLWGVIFPLISEIFTGQKVTVGPTFYERATGPLWAGLLLLMGVAPLSVYGRTSWASLGRAMWKPLAASLVVPAVVFALGARSWPAILTYWLVAFVAVVVLYEFWRGALARRKLHGESLLVALGRLAGRNRRRYGGYIIHLGVVVMALGVIGIELFQTETQATLARGEQLTLGRYVMTYDGLTVYDAADGSKNIAHAVVSVYKDGRRVGQLYPHRDYYYDSQQPMTVPGVRSTLEDDLYVLLVDWQPIAARGATFKVYHNPLANFVWLGGLIFILGTLVAAWPDREPAGVRQPAAGRSGLARA